MLQPPFRRRFAPAGLAASLGLALLSGCSDDGLRVGADVKGDVALSGDVPVTVALDNAGQPISLALTGEVPVNVTLQMPAVADSGTFVSAETMNTFKVNETKAEVVTAILGDPDRASTLSDGSQIWVWQYGPATPPIQVNVITGQDSDEASGTHVTAFVQVRDGVVVALGRG